MRAMTPLPDPHASPRADPPSGGGADDEPSAATGDEPEASAAPAAGPNVADGERPAVEDTGADPQEEAPFRRLDPASVPAARTGSFVALLVLAVPAASLFGLLPFEGSDLGREQVAALRIAAVALWLLLAVRAWVWPRMIYARTRYRLGYAALEIRRGVLFHTWNAVPRSRIQHTDVSSGPIQRRFGVATLQVHTARAARARGRRGLSRTPPSPRRRSERAARRRPRPWRRSDPASSTPPRSPSTSCGAPAASSCPA